MGHDDKAETIRDAKDSKQERSEGVALTLTEAYSEKAVGTLQAQKGTDFVNQKTNIDKVTVGDKAVDLKDGNHETERGAIKDAAKAVANGDTAALQKAFDGLSPEQAKTVAAGLDKAMKPGASVTYDAKHTPATIDIATKPDQKVMIPTDGEAARIGKAGTAYKDGQEATSKDLQEVMEKVQKADQERKAMAGLTLDTKFGAPLSGLKFDMQDGKNEAVPLFREVKQTAAPEKVDSTVFKPDKPVSTSPLETHANSDGSGYQTRDGKIVRIASADSTTQYQQLHKGTDRYLEYDDKGQLNKVSEYQGATGAIWTKQADGKWSDGHGHTRKDMAVSKDGIITYTDSDGAKVTAKPDGSSTHKFPDGRTGVGHSDGSYEEKDKSGHVIKTRDDQYEKHYDKAGHVTSSTVLGVVRESGGNLRLVEGATTYFDKDGHKTKVTHPDGTSEEYDKQGHVTKEVKLPEKVESKPAKPVSTSPLETHANSDGSGYQTRDGKILRIASADSTTQYKQDHKGTDRYLEYDDKGQLNKVSEYQGATGAIWTKQADGKWSDGHGHTRKDMAVSKDGIITYTDSDGAKVTAKPDGSSTHKFPDGRTGVGHSDGSYEEKDKSGHVIKTRDAKQEKHYDKEGHVTSSTELQQVPESGGLLRLVEGDTTYYAKDGHKTKVSHPDGRSEEYDKQGRITKATDAHKHSAEFKYDEAGHATMTKHGMQVPVDVHADGSYTVKSPKSGNK